MDNLFGDDANDKVEDKPKRRRRSKKQKGKFPEPESFEKALEELEVLVARLDEGDVPLEESVEIFERAQFLAQWCQTKLDEIEGRLKLLVPNGKGGFNVETIPDPID